MGRGLTQKIREVLAGWGPGEINLDEIGERLGIQTRVDRERIRNALAELAKRGEVEKVGVNLYQRREREAGQPTKWEVMWRVVRARRQATVTDLMELAGVQRDYAREFLRALVKRGVLVQAGETYRLAAEQVEAPRHEAKAAYLRRYREAKKKALAALDGVFAAVAEARMALADLPEGQDE